MIRIIALFFCTGFLHPTVLHFQFLDVKNLKGIDSLSVWIESLDENIVGTYITREGLKSTLEVRIRKTGFFVTDDARDCGKIMRIVL